MRARTRVTSKKLEVTGIAQAVMRCIGTGLLVFALTSQLVDATLSKTDSKKAASKTLEEKTHHSSKRVQDRGLVVTDSKAKDIILEHKSYCNKKAQERHFLGDVLGYITPWNSHGYDIAKIFGNKFTTVSPVWLQVKRRGKERFQVTGLHDADQGWMKEVRNNAKNIKIVPRILFEGWTYHDFESVFGSEDEIEELSNNLIQVAKKENLDGFVAEVWSQLGNQKQTGLIHLLTHLSEAFHQVQLKIILVIPPAVMPGTNQLGRFTRKEFDQLAPVVDSFSLMTYDYSAPQRPGPNSPLPWMRACVQMLDPEAKWRSKILLGLNFYGMDYSALSASGEPILGNREQYSTSRFLEANFIFYGITWIWVCLGKVNYFTINLLVTRQAWLFSVDCSTSMLFLKSYGLTILSRWAKLSKTVPHYKVACQVLRLDKLKRKFYGLLSKH
ncbi:chitinase domain-containing protein 1 isoform X2 [Rhineura floridana]|uniref:chitinase domain-containing protein 1 isoform X2 n=1 Tax=Rhineura floridana TaxID=261503 RepID=UPI002AC82D39|nr:chitinase domain-containing protein 1 isoform X2 [Rhineura floridana]